MRNCKASIEDKDLNNNIKSIPYTKVDLGCLFSWLHRFWYDDDGLIKFIVNFMCVGFFMICNAASNVSRLIANAWVEKRVHNVINLRILKKKDKTLDVKYARCGVTGEITCTYILTCYLDTHVDFYITFQRNSRDVGGRRVQFIANVDDETKGFQSID